MDTREEKKQERRKIYNTIEIIENTRLKNSGYPVQLKEICLAVRTPQRKIEGTIRWLLRHGLIYRNGTMGYKTKPIPSKGLCWLHGKYFEAVTDCPKCKRAEQRLLNLLIQKQKKLERKGLANESRKLRRINKQAHPRYYTERIRNAVLRGRDYIKTGSRSIRKFKLVDEAPREEVECFEGEDKE